MSARGNIDIGRNSRAIPASTGQLSVAAAHEINNPLNSILNLLYLVEAEAILTEKGRHYLSLVREEVNRISQIAQQSLDQSKLAMMPEKFNVGELLNRLVEFYKQILDSSGASVRTRYSSDVSILGYPAKLRQALSNLLLNAVDAMPQGGTIQIRVAEGHEWGREERKGIRVTVADNGSGIAPEVLPRIFQRFSTKSGGHGIGLSVVQEVVHTHRGLLRVRSNTQLRQHGTVFTLFLPSA